MKANEKSELTLLGEINQKLEILILLISLQGRERAEKVNLLKNYDGPISKRELERITGIDRHEF